MIVGTIVLEDTVVHIGADSEAITVRVCDILSGLDVEKKVSYYDFGCALFIAFAGDDNVPDGIYGPAETAMPTREEVCARLVQLFDTTPDNDSLEKAWHALRWIP